MTNADAIKLLSPRTKALLREHAKALSVDEAKLASDLFEMMAQDGVRRHRCRGAARTRSTEVHHIVPLADGGEDTIDKVACQYARFRG